MIRVTDVQLHFTYPQKGLIAFANIVLNNAISLRSIAVYEKQDKSGYRLTYPTQKKGFYLFNPINVATSKAIETAIFQKLKTVTGPNHDRYHHSSTG